MYRRDVLRAIGAGLGAACCPGYAQESYAVYQPSPRLLLSEDRLRLLRREHERRTERWRQLELLIQGEARFPEPAFALALAHLATGDESLARRAFDALQPNTSPNQVAMVSDWCGDVLSAPQRATLNQRLTSTVNAGLPADASPARVRDLTLAAVTVADDLPEASARALGWVHQQWWPRITSAIEAGRIPVPHREALPFVEVIYSFQRGLQLDLRESAVVFFREYPIWHLLRHYPPSFGGGENDYRIPAFSGNGEPDIDDATLSRAAELAMVALDSNAQESQYLQGWLLNPRFRLRGALGAPYEYFWCNPYQPSLSYFYLPLYQHLPASNSLLARSSWEENATWLGMVDGAMQLFTEEGIRLVEAGRNTRLLPVGPSSIVMEGKDSAPGGVSRVTAPECERLFWLNLRGNTRYEVEIDGEEMAEFVTSKGGVLELDLSNRGGGGVALRPATASASANSA
ncbi:MAG: hypothetical protein KIT83_12800 [Bryobacterales bacterium]|nr:hypothetical protein [Bryobacterales bacterium]